MADVDGGEGYGIDFEVGGRFKMWEVLYPFSIMHMTIFKKKMT